MKGFPKPKAFNASLAFSIIAICINFISFVSPFWIQSKSSEKSLFMRIGLWTACFDGYMLPNQYDKAYFGCFYIYYVEYDAIRQWINPTWLYAIQVLSSLGLMAQVMTNFFLICQACDTIVWNNLYYMKLMVLSHFFTGLTNVCAIVAFSVASHDSRWMPYPEKNILSWAYGLAYVSLFFSAAAMVSLSVLFLTTDPPNDEEGDVYLEPPMFDNKEYANEMELLPRYPPAASRPNFEEEQRLLSQSPSEVYDPRVPQPDYVNPDQNGVYLGKPPSDLQI